MNTSINANAGKQVENIVFFNSRLEIVCFKQFATPLLYEKITPVSFYTASFKKAIIQFTDGTAYTFNQRTTKTVYGQTA